MQNVVCVCDFDPKIFKVPLISLLIWACAFYSVIFLSKCNTIFKVPYIRLETAYTFLIGLGLEIAAVSLFFSYLCQCHESSCHLLMFPSPLTLCVELLVNVYCDVLNLKSWFPRRKL